MSDATTVDAQASWLSDARATTREVTALVIAWSLDEPNRVGQAALIADGGNPRMLGRGAGSSSDEHARLLFHRQRPGQNEATDPLRGGALSRDQLLIRPVREALHVDNCGRCKLSHCGVEVAEARVVPGDTLLLQGQLLLVCVRRPLQYPASKDWPAADTGPFGAPDSHGFVGESAPMWQLRENVAFRAARDQHLLVLGESGVGKELVAQAVHEQSERSNRRMVSRNAATIPSTLIDAELFGNVRDYPNPGMKERPGLIGEADGSTLFLDEIGEISAEMQAHLLRVLDSGGEYQRLGESIVRRSNLRVLAATNRDPQTLKHDLVGRFKLRLQVPGLAERVDDIPLLIGHLLRVAATKDTTLGERFFVDWDGRGGGTPRIDPILVDHLCRHQYTLHVRELESILWTAISSSDGAYVKFTEATAAIISLPTSEFVAAADLTPEQVQSALDDAGGNQSAAYKALGLKNRDVLYRLIKKHGLTVAKET